MILKSLKEVNSLAFVNMPDFHHSQDKSFLCCFLYIVPFPWTSLGLRG